MTGFFRIRGGRPPRRCAALLAFLLLLTVFLACPGFTTEAEAESGKGNSRNSPRDWENITDVVVGEGFTAALREDGRVLYAGEDYSGVKERIAGWEQIERIEVQGGAWRRYLIGYREDGSIRMEALYDRDDDDDWSEEDFAAWSGVKQLILSFDYALGLTGRGTVLTLSKDPLSDELCRELAGWTNIRQIVEGPTSEVLGLRTDGRVVCAAGEYGGDAKAFWEGPSAPKNIRELVACTYGTCAIDEKGTVVSGPSGMEGWTNIDRLYFASDSMFGLRRDGTVAVFFGYAPDDPRLREITDWDHIVELGFDITGWARYVPVGLREDGTIRAVTTDYGEPYGEWDFTGWRNVKKLFSGTNFTIGLCADGSVLVTGGEFGKLDYLDEIAGWTDIREIFAAEGDEWEDHIVGLKTDGTLVAAGDNSFGQCEVGG